MTCSQCANLLDQPSGGRLSAPKETTEEIRFMLACLANSVSESVYSGSPTVNKRQRVERIDQIGDLDVWRSWVEAWRVTRPSISNCDLVHNLQLS
jgi:hypothetical protein